MIQRGSLSLLFTILFFSGCDNSSFNQPADKELAILEQFRDLSIESQLKIAYEDEPGEQLLLCLTFIEKESGTPLADQLVEFYHTDIDGEYRPSSPGVESTARLSGSATTDTEGRIFVETILPGDYGSSSDNRHIHTTVHGATPEGYDIHFRQYSGIMGRNFINNSDQHFLADLRKTLDGRLLAFLTIDVKNPI